MNHVSKTFCVLPWTHLATYTDGSVLLCCVAKNNLRLNLNETTLAKAWNSDVLMDVRQKMLRGQPVSSCARCYSEESVGYESHRVAENKAWERRFTKEWLQGRIDSTQENGHLEETLVSVDLRLGNTCNLTCVMCRPKDSSKWTGLAKKLENSVRNEGLYHEWKGAAEINQSRFEWYKNSEFWQDLLSVLPSARQLILGGGEPMLLDEHLALIEACVSSGHAEHIQLRYHTNGTILDEKIFELWKHFKLVEIFVSVDAIGERNHYMRHPAVWSNIEKNLHKLDGYPHNNLRILLLCSVHLMSVFYLDEFAKWIEDQNFKLVSAGTSGYFHPGVVHEPAYLSIQVLPENLKKIITEKVQAFESVSKNRSPKIGGILNFMNAADQSHLLTKSKEYIRSLDEARKTSFAKTLPELQEHLQF